MSIAWEMQIGKHDITDPDSNFTYDENINFNHSTTFYIHRLVFEFCEGKSKFTYILNFRFRPPQNSNDQFLIGCDSICYEHDMFRKYANIISTKNVDLSTFLAGLTCSYNGIHIIQDGIGYTYTITDENRENIINIFIDIDKNINDRFEKLKEAGIIWGQI